MIMDIPGTDFSRHREFQVLYESIPREARAEWVLRLTKEQLKLADFKTGWTVAHDLAVYGTLTETFLASFDEETVRELLLLRNKKGWTVAHFLASQGTLPRRYVTMEEILLAAEPGGWTVAHDLAQSGNFPEECAAEGLFLMEDSSGWTVGQELAAGIARYSKWIQLTRKILGMPCGDGRIVADFVADILREEKLFICDLSKIFEQISGESLALIESRTKDQDLKTAIIQEIDKREGAEIFTDRSPVWENDIASDLYEAERER